ncbi:MAG: deoxyribodipyrimidine photo-lyase [Planctomycetes bacterium]|jgi:deoxyribodipyrimidine photo-lyase|nr:deoxyribodipyrimidine photo-lyase [Planctomycetota bacterium]
MNDSKPTIVWFRSDLRVSDNPALSAAVARGGPVIPVFIWAPEEEKPWAPGGARRWWLHQSLDKLQRALQGMGSDLVLRQGASLSTLRQLIADSGADTVYWHRRYEPAVIERDKKVKQDLKDDGLDAQSFNSHLLYEPWEVATKQGDPYKVFTPFWKTCTAMPEPDAPLEAPARGDLPQPDAWPESDPLDALGLMPKVEWYKDIASFWTPGESGAQERLDTFLNDAIRAYKENRDVPSIDATSRLSPYLCHGEIGPRQVWHTVRRFMQDGRRNLSKSEEKQCWAYLREIGWREFGYHVLYHFPHTPDKPLQKKYADFPWVNDESQLHAWQKGRTGYPLIDAGMRQLWRIGWMHNRVRMVVASFLVKDLLISWQEGARWFWDTLVDADLANNTLGWQWAGGCGADAAPYFRIFNPILQSKKFDANGDYIRTYVDELKHVKTDDIHAPWEAAAPLLDQTDYAAPLIDHKEARDRALAALDEVTG